MPLDPQCAALIEAVNKAGNAFELKGIEGARLAYSATTKLYRSKGPNMAKVRNRVMPGPQNTNLPVRIYNPVSVAEGDKNLPVLVFFHGGGWAVGDLDTHDHVCREMAHRSSCVVISVGYRMAPEFPFPAAIDDCVAALTWVGDNAAVLGCDRSRIAIGGDSAGGNLAAVVARRNRDRKGPEILLQLLIYPATDFGADTPSIRENGDGYILTKAAMDHFRGLYLEDDAEWMSPYASPLLADDFENLPPAFVVTAEYDPLRDEGKAYADKLSAAGVPVCYQCYGGMIHGFFRMGGLVDKVTIALDDAAMALRKAFSA